MVTFNDHRFTLAGVAYNAGRRTAYWTPTVFSDLAVRYGADTCSDHPTPATMAGRVFIPASMAGFYPTLNVNASYAVGGPGGMAPVFRGRVEALTEEDVPGFTPPARIPNSRNMTTLTPGLAASRWNFYTTAYDVPEVPSTGALTATPGRVQAAPGALATTQPRSVRIVTPYAPVTAGEGYAFTATAHESSPSPIVLFQWYSTAAPAGFLHSDYGQMPPLSAPTGQWYGIATDVATAPPGAQFVRVSVQLTPADSGPHDGYALLENVTLLTAAERKLKPAGRWIDFEAADVTAAAARLMLSDAPWPSESAASRATRINGLIPRGVMYFSTDPIDYTELAYRDVDNQSALTLFQRVATSIGTVVVASPQYETLITTGRRPRSAFALDVVAGAPKIVDDAELVKIPAGSIVDGPLSTSITGLSNNLNFSYRSWVGEGTQDATATLQNNASVALYGPMARSMDTDLPAPMGKAWDVAQHIINNQAAPVYRLADSTNVVLSELPETQPSWDLFNAVEGFRRLVHIPDAPARIGPYHRVAGAQMVFGKKPSLKLELEPAHQVMSDAVTFQDLSMNPYRNLTQAQFANLTFDQLDSASPVPTWA